MTRREIWDASDLGKLYARAFENPALEVTLYARVQAGVLTTITWRLLPHTDCNGTPSGWWVATVRIGAHSRTDCADPFYSTERIIQKLNEETP